MKPKEIHDLLLSLLVRGLGFWVLYDFVTGQLYEVLTYLPNELFFDKTPNWPNIMFDYIRMIVHLAAAIFLILGAPPLLKWATRGRS